MFIVVYFGYKQYRIYTIDCLTASLMDTIWNCSLKDMLKLLTTREEMHSKEIANLQKRQQANEKKLEKIEAQLEEEKKKAEEASAERLTEVKGITDSKGKVHLL
jgi:chromosome segregation ATPase